MLNEKNDVAVSKLRRHLEQSIKEHSHGVDSALYNGGTAAVILATALATFLPDLEGLWSWLPRTLTAFAAFWIALERALNFGARWRFHVEMKSGYRAILASLDILELVPEEDRAEYVESLRHDLLVLHRREAALPGVGFVALAEESDR